MKKIFVFIAVTGLIGCSNNCEREYKNFYDCMENIQLEDPKHVEWNVDGTIKRSRPLRGSEFTPAVGLEQCELELDDYADCKEPDLY